MLQSIRHHSAGVIFFAPTLPVCDRLANGSAALTAVSNTSRSEFIKHLKRYSSSSGQVSTAIRQLAPSGTFYLGWKCPKKLIIGLENKKLKLDLSSKQMTDQMSQCWPPHPSSILKMSQHVDWPGSVWPGLVWPLRLHTNPLSKYTESAACTGCLLHWPTSSEPLSWRGHDSSTSNTPSQGILLGLPVLVPTHLSQSWEEPWDMYLPVHIIFLSVFPWALLWKNWQKDV